MENPFLIAVNPNPVIPAGRGNRLADGLRFHGLRCATPWNDNRGLVVGATVIKCQEVFSKIRSF